jgi:hypothetical protein
MCAGCCRTAPSPATVGWRSLVHRAVGQGGAGQGGAASPWLLSVTASSLAPCVQRKESRFSDQDWPTNRVEVGAGVDVGTGAEVVVSEGLLAQSLPCGTCVSPNYMLLAGTWLSLLVRISVPRNRCHTDLL